jgi:hypothetical protein
MRQSLASVPSRRRPRRAAGTVHEHILNVDHAGHAGSFATDELHFAIFDVLATGVNRVEVVPLSSSGAGEIAPLRRECPEHPARPRPCGCSG